MNYFINLRRFVSPGFALCSAICLMFAASSVFAQTALTGGLRGNITDANGAAIPAAIVRLENKTLSIKQEVVTDADGRFTILRLIPDVNYEMQITANGFRQFVSGGINVVSGETNVIDARLDVSAVSETVDVNGTESQLEQRAEISQVVSAEQLAELPIFNRTIQRAALLDPHVRNTSPIGGDTSNSTRLSINGRIYRETHYELDGANNTDFVFNNAPAQTVSLSSIQEFKVLTNQYAAEHGGTTAGFVILTTKSGTNEFRGEGFFNVRPSGIGARPPLANRRIPNQRLEYGASFGGPIFKEKTFFFANYEGTRQDRGSFVDRPTPQVFLGNLRENLGLVKVDHRFTDNHSIGFRLNGARYTNTNTNDRITFLAQSSQPIQPSAAARSILQNVGTQLNDTYTKGNFVNEFRVSYLNALPSTSVPLTPQAVVIRTGISTEGNSTFSNYRLQITEFADIMSLQLGRHSLKFGGNYTRQMLHEVAFQQFGTYTFNAAGTLTQFSQVLGVNNLRSGQTQTALFVQDDFRLTNQLTLNIGLRHDYQSIIKDKNNFGPRLGFAYDVGGRGTTVVRGGAGVYYDQPFYHGFTQRYLQGGLDSQTRTISFSATQTSSVEAQLAAAGIAFPNSFNPLTPFNSLSPFLSNAPRNLFLKGENIRSPYTAQFSLGVQQKIYKDFVFNADVIHNFSRKQLTVFNQNAPAPFIRTSQNQFRGTDNPQTAAQITAAQALAVTLANQSRPFFNPATRTSIFQGVTVRDVLTSFNAGNSEYDALSVGVTKRFGSRYTFSANYVYSSALDSVTDDHLGANPNDFNDVVGAERAQSDFNQRHRFVAYGTINLPLQIEFTGVATLASGLRINPLTGFDNNGDGINTDRPAGFARNSFVGPSHRRFDASFVKKIAMKSLGETMRLELRADIYNAFNNSNFYRFNNRYGNLASGLPEPTLAQPLSGISSVDPGRQIQFGARFVF